MRFRDDARRAAVLGLLWSFSVVARAGNPLADFKSPIDESKMEFPLKPGEVDTPVLKKFKATGINDYRGDAQAIARGKELFDQLCQVCHGADAGGKMCPALVGSEHIYPQTFTDPGMFSIVYGGASGAMQAFSRRDVSQDDIIHIIAYVRSLDR